jgi:antitoxin-like ribbon-helix-helix protein
MLNRLNNMLPDCRGKEVQMQPPFAADTKFVGGHFERKAHKALRLLIAEEDTIVRALLEEPLDLLFVKKGKGRSPTPIPESSGAAIAGHRKVVRGQPPPPL